MIDPALTLQVRHAATAAGQRSKLVNLDQWLDRLAEVSQSLLLSERVKAIEGKNWSGALPSWEFTGLTKKPQGWELPAVGIDGSQIFPEEDEPVLWSYVQALAYAQKCSPLLRSQFTDIGTEMVLDSTLSDMLWECRYNLRGLVSTWRNLLELRVAEEAVKMYPNHIALIDNGLLPWMDVSGKAGALYLQAHKQIILAMKLALLAGIISSPRSELLARMILLFEAKTLDEGMFARGGVNDIAMMRHALAEGERSAIFAHASPLGGSLNRVGINIYFFFLRTRGKEILRVEIPGWVAENPDLVDTIHSSILADAVVGGYSYCLSQAHQQVMITGEIANLLRGEARNLYFQGCGELTEGSAKSLMKRRKA